MCYYFEYLFFFPLLNFFSNNPGRGGDSCLVRLSLQALLPVLQPKILHRPINMHCSENLKSQTAFYFYLLLIINITLFRI
jgi:hypothetical protein